MNRDAEILFHELADLSPAERESYLTERRVSAEVRAEVEALLRFDVPVDHVITDHVARMAKQALSSVDAKATDRCGPYRLIRLLGSGGMGSVYLGERDDGEVEQQVAVKLLRFRSEEAGFEARFLQERQILASLNHPGIARLLDAGHTDDGQPYLAMDYIDGTPIDRYSESLALRRVLALFVQVCDAITYAHRNLIIHRDLKPSNILVDKNGRPKLLDFGIAKILEAGGDQTQTVDQLLTPEYASPEQIRGTSQSTATDVYSLGAVLYKLLTRRSPHDFPGETRQHMMVAACEREPALASRVNPDLPRDLDFILAKALRKEPDERYSSVEALAEDLCAFLEWRPVRARSGSAWYRMRKFARRYWAPVTAGVVAMASLSIGFYIANHERVIAQQRFSQLRQLSNRVFELDGKIRDLPGSTEARQQLVSASLEYLEGLGAAAHGDLDLSEEIGRAYMSVAEVQGVPTTLNLGEFAKADANLKKAEDLIDSVLRARPGNHHALLVSVEIGQDRMILAESEHRRGDALEQSQNAAVRLDQLLRLGNTSSDERRSAGQFYANIALANLNVHRLADSVRYSRQAVDLVRPIRALPTVGQILSGALSTLAMGLRAQGELEAALAAIQEAAGVAEATRYATDTARMFGMYNVYYREGVILGEDGGINLGRSEDAVAALQKAFEVTENLAARDPRDFTSRSRVATAGRALGNILRHRDPVRAVEIYDLAIRRLGEIPRNLKVQRDRAQLMAESAEPLRQLRRESEARNRIRQALAIFAETKDYPADRVRLGSEAYVVLIARAEDDLAAGDSRRAVEEFQEVLSKVRDAKPDVEGDLGDANQLSGLYESLQAAFGKAKDSVQAENMRALRLAIWQRWDKQRAGNAFVREKLAAALGR